MKNHLKPPVFTNIRHKIYRIPRDSNGQTKKGTSFRMSLFGARGGSRTRTPLRALAPEASESTNSTTRASGLALNARHIIPRLSSVVNSFFARFYGKLLYFHLTGKLTPFTISTDNFEMPPRFFGRFERDTAPSGRLYIYTNVIDFYRHSNSAPKFQGGFSVIAVRP